jgi:hypothetical protein
MTPMSALIVSIALTFAGGCAHADDVIVNDVRLDDGVRRTLERMYNVEIEAGRYWYDPVSGVWGRDGGPAVGIVHAGLPLGGPLRRDASRGNTGVIVNGRELHALDVAALQRCVPVQRGRYWVHASGFGGHEGGPPLFNLAALCGGGSSGGGVQCDGSGSCGASATRSGVTGIVSEGGGRAGVSYNGKYIMTPN